MIEPEVVAVPDVDAAEYVVVQSPNSKARAARAKQQGARTNSFADDDRVETLAEAKKGGSQTRGGRLPKSLPTPPVGPVLPDFDDLMPTRTRSRGEPVDQGVKRKASVVKKLKDRMR